MIDDRTIANSPIEGAEMLVGMRKRRHPSPEMASAARRDHLKPRERRPLAATVAFFTAALFASSAMSGCSVAPAVANEAAATPVTVALPLQANIVGGTDLTGQFSAINSVAVLAQVSGYLKEVHFRDGQLVHKGDLLFVIDPRPYEVQLQQALAQRSAAMASLGLATKQLGRSSELSQAGAESLDLFDQATQTKQSAQAAMMSADAAIRAARLNLEFCHIRAPFTGRMSNRRVSIGSLVTSGPAAIPMTSIVSLDPLYFDFDLSESDYGTFQRTMSARAGSKASVKLSLDGEAEGSRTGLIDFIDNAVDRSSGTIHARATIPNPDAAIAPGQFARVRVPLSGAQPSLLVPDAAIGTDQSARTVVVIGPDDVARPRQVQIGELQQGGMRVVTSGLHASERIAVDGLMQIRPGTKVAARLIQLQRQTRS